MENRSFYQLTKDERHTIHQIATRCPSNLASAEAQSIYLYYFKHLIPICHDNPKIKSSVFEGIDKSKFKYPKIKAFLRDAHPNPTKDYTNIGYYLPKGQNGTITINDLFGHKIYEFKIYEGENTLQLSTSALQAGVYIYGMVVDGATVDYKKLIIIK